VRRHPREGPYTREVAAALCFMAEKTTRGGSVGVPKSLRAPCRATARGVYTGFFACAVQVGLKTQSMILPDISRIGWQVQCSGFG